MDLGARGGDEFSFVAKSSFENKKVRDGFMC